MVPPGPLRSTIPTSTASPRPSVSPPTMFPGAPLPGAAAAAFPGAPMPGVPLPLPILFRSFQNPTFLV